MANPAQLLFNQLALWQISPPTPPNTRAATVRQVRNPTEQDFLAHRIAIRHLEAIDQLLTEMTQSGAGVGVYRKYFPAWCKAVFAYPHGWEATPAGADIPDVCLEHLQNLAEMFRYYVPALQPNGLDSIRNYAQQIKDALVADTSLPEQLRIHAHEVILHLLWCADHYDIVGDFILADAVERLAATIVRVAANSSEENRTNVWSRFANTFVWPFAVNLMAAIPSQALAQLALGSGG